MKNKLLKTKNKSIWKFKLDTVSGIEMPIGSEILSVQFQDDILCIWALVDPNAVKTEIRKFVLIGTGNLIEIEEAKYITTLQYGKVFGHFNQVYHLFEI